MKDKVRSPISGEEVSPKMKFGVKIKAGAKMIKVVNGIKINGQKPKAKKSIAVKKNKKVSK